jgi:hypothetical protein
MTDSARGRKPKNCFIKMGYGTSIGRGQARREAVDHGQAPDGATQNFQPPVRRRNIIARMAPLSGGVFPLPTPRNTDHE